MPQTGTNKSLELVAVFNSGTMKAADEDARANQLIDWPLALLLGLHHRAHPSGGTNCFLLFEGSKLPFDQDSTLEFQVITAGYKAESGHGSGGVVNVVARRGTHDWHGPFTFFHRISAIDTSHLEQDCRIAGFKHETKKLHRHCKACCIFGRCLGRARVCPIHGYPQSLNC